MENGTILSSVIMSVGTPLAEVKVERWGRLILLVVHGVMTMMDTPLAEFRMESWGCMNPFIIPGAKTIKEHQIILATAVMAI